jgi:hypothetical protein
MSGNKNIVLIMGPPRAGKSHSLMSMRDKGQMVYLNTDMKDLPFGTKFGSFMANVEVSNAMDIFQYITQIEQEPTCKGGILDTLTFLMNMYERQYVNNSPNTQKAWGDYGNFYREFIHAIKAGSKDYAIMAHEDFTLNEKTMEFESKVPVKGAVGRIGVEADFTTILGVRTVSMKQLEGHENSLLNITDDEREDDSKSVFVTRPANEFKGGKMRMPFKLWERSELYIDNDLQQVFDRLRSYYGQEKAA